eukprot:TRINITY_DN16638_c0_g1_i2.p1 TRINITY_DN16638_c0_g1~~TRINITY_DN16638_c0_g1_i2.p1  ORF type:complete len:509 (+),score=95.10 TRINITY_DN16638_c0_g1_i2:148-1674(+)
MNSLFYWATYFTLRAHGGGAKAAALEPGKLHNTEGNMKRAVVFAVVVAMGAVAVQLPSIANDLHLRGGGGGGGEDLNTHERVDHHHHHNDAHHHDGTIHADFTYNIKPAHDNKNSDNTEGGAVKASDKTVPDGAEKEHRGTRPPVLLLAVMQLGAVLAFFWYKGEGDDNDDLSSTHTTPYEQTLVVEVSQFGGMRQDGIRNRSEASQDGEYQVEEDRSKGWRWKGDWRAPVVIGGILIGTWLFRPHGMSDPKPNVWKVFYFAWVTDLATGLGALPFLCVHKVSKRYLGRANAIASGMMSSASLQLFIEAVDSDPLPSGLWATPLSRCVAGMALGLAFIIQAKKFLDKHNEIQFADLSLLDTKKVLLIIMVMTLHSFTEGVGIGVSFGGDRGSTVGFCISVCLTIHNIPEGLAVALVLIPRGISKLNTFLWCILTSLPQPLMAVPAYIFVESFLPLLPVGLGFASGAMLWVAFCELLEEAAADTSRRQATAISTTAFTLAYILQHIMTD